MEPENNSALLELAARIEAAGGPSKALDREIALAVGWVRQTPSEARRKHPAWFHPDDCRDGEVVFDSLHGTDVWRDPLPYTTSIDAALTLVPEGAFWSITMRGESRPGFHACCQLDGPLDWREGATAPLALCAAALRAKAAQ